MGSLEWKGEKYLFACVNQGNDSMSSLTNEIILTCLYHFLTFSPQSFYSIMNAKEK